MTLQELRIKVNEAERLTRQLEVLEQLDPNMDRLTLKDWSSGKDKLSTVSIETEDLLREVLKAGLEVVKARKRHELEAILAPEDPRSFC